MAVGPRVSGSRRVAGASCGCRLLRAESRALFPRDLLPLGHARGAVAGAVVLLLGDPGLHPATLLALELQDVRRRQPGAHAGACPEVADVRLAVGHPHVRRPGPDEEHEPEAARDAGHGVDVALAPAEGDPAALGALVAGGGVLVPPLVEELHLAALVAVGVRQRHRAAVAPVGGLLRAPQHVGPLLSREDLVLAPDALAPPPDRVELDVVGVRRVAHVVGVADGRLVEHHRLPILLDHCIYNLLGHGVEHGEVPVGELRLLLIPRPCQVVPVSPPNVLKLLDVRLRENANICSVVGPASDVTLRRRAVPEVARLRPPPTGSAHTWCRLIRYPTSRPRHRWPAALGARRAGAPAPAAGGRCAAGRAAAPRAL
mmetsp:Transcript_91493/g.259120  ORF Transcript_91493/g.259120 Transcript_91493/m.259120 type:complete len:372 (+) Transcript_91493:1064-2179(+)